MADPLDHTGLLCDRFYDLKAPLGRDRKGNSIVQPGQLVLAHQVYPTAQPMIIEVKGYDPRDESKNTYVFAKYDATSGSRPHFPVKELNLRADENLYVMYGKKRPAIVLQTISTDFFNQQNPEPYVWVVPCFTFKDKHKAAYRIPGSGYGDAPFVVPPATPLRLGRTERPAVRTYTAGRGSRHRTRIPRPAAGVSK